MSDNLTPNQRTAPRFKTNFTAKVESPYFCINACVTNISTGGLQLTCDFHALQEIMPNIKRSDNHLPIQFKVQFAVPTQQKDAVAIQLECALVYTRRVKTDLAIVGCQFVNLDQTCSEALEDYLTHFAVPV